MLKHEGTVLRGFHVDGSRLSDKRTTVISTMTWTCYHSPPIPRVIVMVIPPMPRCPHVFFPELLLALPTNPLRKDMVGPNSNQHPVGVFLHDCPPVCHPYCTYHGLGFHKTRASFRLALSPHVTLGWCVGCYLLVLHFSIIMSRYLANSQAGTWTPVLSVASRVLAKKHEFTPITLFPAITGPPDIPGSR